MAVKVWLGRAQRAFGRRINASVVDELRELRKEIAALRRASRPQPARACPICLASFGSFNEFRGRANARCPRCGSFERHRLSWLYLQQQTALFRQPTRFLHFAPEQVMQQRIESNFNVTYTAASYDPDKPDEGVDIQRLPYADQSFDLAYCSHVLEHIPDDRRAMREIHRVLVTGGTALIMVPTGGRDTTYEDPSITSPDERAKHFGRWDHVRLYGRDLLGRLREAGFDVNAVYHNESLSTDEQLRYGLASEPIFVCHRL